MRNRFAAAGITILCAIAVACAAPPTALPQQLQTIPWTYLSPLGDTVAGRIGFVLNIDTVAARVVVNTQVDTLWCTAGGVCSRTRPPVPTDTVVPVVRGIPFGPFALWGTYTTVKWGPAPFTASQNYTDANGIIRQLDAARAMKQKLHLAMTGGAHCLYLTLGCDAQYNGLPGGVFDMAKWKAKMNTFNTAAIKTAVAAGVADGTIIGNSVMDEPEVTGGGDGNTWGPAGTMTKPRVDSLAAYVKAMFPTLPVGVNHGPVGYYQWRPTERYRVVDYVNISYVWWVTQGDVTTWRDKVLAQARLDGVPVAFTLNIRNGGVQNWATKLCPIPLTGGYGTYSPNCQMTPQQIRDWSQSLGPYGCMLLLWEFNSTFMAKAENLQAFKDVAAQLATSPRRSCRRP